MTSAIDKNLEQTLKELQSQKTPLNQAEKKLLHYGVALHQSQQRIESIEASFSWKITAPYRALSDTLKFTIAKILSSDRQRSSFLRFKKEGLIATPPSAPAATNAQAISKSDDILQTSEPSPDLTGVDCLDLSRQSKLALSRLTSSVRTLERRR